MCLDEITDRNPKSEGEGYITVARRNKRLYGVFYGSRRQTGRWLNERDFRIGKSGRWNSGKGNFISSHRSGKYLKGFHIHLSKAVALFYLNYEPYTVRKVKYRKAIVIGTQSAYDKWPVVVAQEMYIYPGKVK